MMDIQQLITPLFIACCIGATWIITRSYLFSPLRTYLDTNVINNRNEQRRQFFYVRKHLYKLTSCFVCCSLWVSVGLALIWNVNGIIIDLFKVGLFIGGLFACIEIVKEYFQDEL